MVLKGENSAHLFYFEDLAQKADIPYNISCTQCWKDTGVEIINYPRRDFAQKAKSRRSTQVTHAYIKESTYS